MDRYEQQERRRGVSTSVKAAVAIAVAVAGYFAFGTLVRGPEPEPPATAPREDFAVLVRTVERESRPFTVTLRGRTEADRSVAVRAETAARIVDVSAEEGQEVEAGALLCRLEDGGRSAGMTEARAALSEAEADFEAAERLFAEGFASEADLDTARARRDAALARLERARKEAANTELRAPMAGTVSEVPVEAGDVLNAGGVCAVVADLSTTVIAGGLDAGEVEAVQVGDRATVRVGEERFEATVRFVSPVAGARTRAFRVELEAEERALREGLRAVAEIASRDADASFVPRSALVFGDDGRLGVRVIAEADGRAGTVGFHPVAIVGEVTGGAFVAGLPPRAHVIVRGQDYVSAGTRVAFEEEA